MDSHSVNNEYTQSTVDTATQAEADFHTMTETSATGSDGENTFKKKRRIDSKYWKIGMVVFCVLATLILFYFAFFQNHTLFGFFQLVWSKVQPFLVGAVLAYLLKPICKVFEKWVAHWFKGLRDRHKAHVLTTRISVAFTMIIFLAFVYVIFAAIIPGLLQRFSSDNLSNVFRNISETANGFFDWMSGKFSENQDMLNNINTWRTDVNGLLSMDSKSSLFKSVTEWTTKYLQSNSFTLISNITSGVKGLFNGLLNVFIALISCIYIMCGRKKLASQSTMLVYSIFPEKAANKVMDEVHFCDRMFSGFINGKILDSIIIGILCYVVMMILGIREDALVISVVIGVTNVIPFFGPFIGAIPCGLLLLLKDPGSFDWLKFAIAILAIQQLDGNVIGPKIVGNTTGVSSFWVLFSITLFGALWGFAGMIIGVPLFAVLYDIIRQLVAHGLDKRGKRNMMDDYEAREQRYAKEKEDKKKEKSDKRKQRIKNLGRGAKAEEQSNEPENLSEKQ